MERGYWRVVSISGRDVLVHAIYWDALDACTRCEQLRDAGVQAAVEEAPEAMLDWDVESMEDEAESDGPMLTMPEYIESSNCDQGECTW